MITAIALKEASVAWKEKVVVAMIQNVKMPLCVALIIAPWDHQI